MRQKRIEKDGKFTSGDDSNSTLIDRVYQQKFSEDITEYIPADAVTEDQGERYRLQTYALALVGKWKAE